MNPGVNNNSFMADFYAGFGLPVPARASAPSAMNPSIMGPFNNTFWNGFTGDSFQSSNEQLMMQLFMLANLMQIQENTPLGYNNNAQHPAVTSIKGKSPEFVNKVNEISARIKCNPRDLIALMKAESGLNAQAKNPNSSATGLIQFMDSTAKSLGTTTAELRQMSDVQQLDYVEKYLTRARDSKGLGSLDAGTLYALVFMPSIAKGGSVSGGDAYRLNKGLDKNNDGQIDKADLAAQLARFY